MFSHSNCKLAGPVLIQYRRAQYGLYYTVISVLQKKRTENLRFRLTRLMWRGLHCFHGVHSNERVFTCPVIQLKKATVYNGALEKCDGFFSGCSSYMVGRSEADTVGEQTSPYPLHRAVVLPSMRRDSGDSARSSLGNHNAPVPHGCLLGGTFCKFVYRYMYVGNCISSIIMNIDTGYSCHCR